MGSNCKIKKISLVLNPLKMTTGDLLSLLLFGRVSILSFESIIVNFCRVIYRRIPNRQYRVHEIRLVGSDAPLLLRNFKNQFKDYVI